MGSQEGENGRLLSPSIYYEVCYAVEVILSLIYAALWVLKWRSKGFYAFAFKNNILLRNIIKTEYCLNVYLFNCYSTFFVLY